MSTDRKLVRVNSAMLIMGPTGSGKSSLLATLAIYVWESFGKVTHWVTTDGGGFPTITQGLIQAGIVRVWRARTRDLPDGSLSFETCLRAAQGWWPKRLNALTGECPPGVQLVPPITERYVMSCPNGHVVKTVPFPALLTPAMCPTCKQHTTKENMLVTKTAGQTKGFEDVGAVVFEGLTSKLSWMLSDMGQRAGRLELKGEEGAIGGKIISGDLKLGGSTRSHVGFAQSRAEELVLNSLSIPNLVVPPVWTALTMEATDEGGLSIRGPKLAGKARTDEGPSWFGNCFETAVIKTDKDERQFRLYLSEYTDAEGVRHLVKHRGAPGTMPPYVEDAPIGPEEKTTAFTGFNLGVVLQMLDKALEDTVATLAGKYPDAPGVAEGWVEVGEPAMAAAAGGAPSAGPTVPGAVTPAAGTGDAVPAPATPPTPQAAKPPVARAPLAPVQKPKGPVGRPVVAAKPATPAPAAPAAPVEPGEPAPLASAPAVTAIPPVSPAAQAPQATAGQPGQQTNSPATAKAWAPPSAPRPPAQAPRLRPQAK